MKRKRPCKKDDTLTKLVEAKVEENVNEVIEDYSPKEDYPKEDITFIEVCSGCGGLSTGFCDAGMKPILLNEINKVFCKTLQINHPDVKIVNDSMKNISLTKYEGCVDILCGGIPCQSFSQAGLRKGLNDARGGLALDFNRLINECKPKLFLIENVKGLVNHNGGNTLKTLIELYENNGLYTIKYKVCNAYDFEVPQKRFRVIIVGIRKDIYETKGEYLFPSPVDDDKKLVLKDVLQNVPESKGNTYSENKHKVMSLVPPGGCWIHLPDDIKREYMGEKMLASGGGKRGVARRMSYDEPCLTLTTSPSQKQTERCHPEFTRPFTTREYARIQTFPDTYVFNGTVNQVYTQIGNAVPVKLAYHIGTSLKNYIKR
jgi:DNA (cytosine-5)-methyltransferase 1